MPFWKMLKVGTDEFDLTRRPPTVDVCNKSYVFNADAAGASFNASAPCPQYSVPVELTTALSQKQSADDQAFTVAVASIQAADKRAADKAVADAAEAAAAEARAAERAANPSLVTRILTRVGIEKEQPARRARASGGSRCPRSPCSSRRETVGNGSRRGACRGNGARSVRADNDDGKHGRQRDYAGDVRADPDGGQVREEEDLVGRGRPQRHAAGGREDAVEPALSY